MGKTEVHIRTHYKMYTDNHKIAVCGNIEQLGLWHPDDSIVAVEYPSESGWWCATISLNDDHDLGQPIMFKFAHVLDDGEALDVLRWQEGDTRVLPLFENVFCAWSGYPYADNVMDKDEEGNLLTSIAGRNSVNPELFRQVVALGSESNEDLDIGGRSSLRPPGNERTSTSSSMSPDLTGGNQQERQPSLIHQQALSPVQSQDVTPPLSPDPCCAPDGTRTTSMSQGRDGSLAFKETPSVRAEEPLSAAQPEISSREDSVCAAENETTKQPLAPAKDLYEAGDDSLSSDQDEPVERGMSPASCQSQDELSGIPDHTQAAAPQTASSEPFLFVMPVYRGAMEYTSSGEVSPVDSKDAIYWDDLGDPVGMPPMPWKADDTVLQLDESITLSLADNIVRGFAEAAAAAAPPCESADVYRPLVSDINRQSKQGDTVGDLGVRPGVEGDARRQALCIKCDRKVRCEKCDDTSEMCEDCTIDNACTCVNSDMDEFGMGGQPRDHIIYSKEDRPVSASRSQGPDNVVTSQQPSDTRPRSGSRSGSTPRPASGSAINAAVRQPTARPHSGRRSSRPGSAEVRTVTSGGMLTVEMPTIEIPDSNEEFIDTTLHHVSSQTDHVWISHRDMPVIELPDNCYYSELDAASSQTDVIKGGAIVREQDTNSDNLPPSLLGNELSYDEGVDHKSSQTNQDISAKVNTNAQAENPKRHSTKSLSSQRTAISALVKMTSRQTSVAPVLMTSRQTSVAPVLMTSRQTSVTVPRASTSCSRDVTESIIRPSVSPLMASNPKDGTHSSASHKKKPDAGSQCCSVM